MTIESTLERIAVALEKIANPQISHVATYTKDELIKADPGPMIPVSEPAATEPKRRGRPPKVEPDPVQPSKPVKLDASPMSFLDDPAPAGATKVYTLEEVREALVACQKRTFPERARKALKDAGGVDVLPQLAEDRFAAVIAAANAA